MVAVLYCAKIKGHPYIKVSNHGNDSVSGVWGRDDDLVSIHHVTLTVINYFIGLTHSSLG